MATPLLYKNTVPLDREQHKDLMLKAGDGDCSFAADVGYVPIAGVEMVQAARDYPVLLSTQEKGMAAVVLLGLGSRNLFLGADGRWEKGCYVPAYVRRYPFVLGRGQKDESFTVCVDDTYSGLSNSEGERLFDDGKETQLLQKSIAFLRQYQTEMERTQVFLGRLKDLDLLKARDMQLSDAEGKMTLVKGFEVINEEKLGELDDEVVLEFHKAGFWPWVFAHLMSLGNMANLQRRQR